MNGHLQFILPGKIRKTQIHAITVVILVIGEFSEITTEMQKTEIALSFFFRGQRNPFFRKQACYSGRY